MVDEYLTILAPSEGMFKDRGSKFLAFAHPVRSEGEVKGQVDLLRKTYHDARHHCFAWILGVRGDRYRAFDDGEPNHSAGDPILGQIRSRGLTNTLVVVVRYFGGTKLGVGGLIAAYRAAAEEALRNASIVTKRVSCFVKMSYPYESTSILRRLAQEMGAGISDQVYTDLCEETWEIVASRLEELDQKVLRLQSQKIPVSMESIPTD